MSRPKTVYRGKRKYRWVITLTACVLVLLIAGGVFLFNYMQKFIVYDKDGLRLRLPIMEQTGDGVEELPEEEEIVFTPLENVEIVVDEPDYADVDLANRDLGPIHARYVSAESMSADNLRYFAFDLDKQGQDAMILQLKTSGGYLSYQSEVPLTDSYGVNGSADIRASVLEMKEKDVYLVAELSCLLDDAMAERNVPLALKNSVGGVLTDGSGSWLDPRNQGVRDYLIALLTEVAAMGFDEVLLSGLSHPKAADINYSQDMTASPAIGGSVATFAVFLSETARELGLNCSVVCEAAYVRSGTGADIGQDYELFGRVFDRLYLKTSGDFAAADMSMLDSAAEQERVVPILMGTAPDCPSWAVQ